MRKRPEAAGLYDPGYEHDNCGIGAVADLTGAKKHETVTRALTVLDHLEHRGASGAEIDTGDGAGLLCQVPDEFFRAVLDFEVPQAGEYAVGVMFLPSDDEARRRDLEGLIERTIAAEGQTLLGWRDVPVDHSVPGPSASEVEPTIRQVFIGKQVDGDQDAFERKVYVIRRVIEREAGEDLAIPSFSSKTIVYKGMLTSPQLPRYYEDLGD
jgi:glutamate synthase domain-containing protein 1